jgi:AcrR family transcriptional regulator
VLAAAVDLFLADGYPGTSIAAIAERAAVSADTIYHLFGNKRTLLKAALDDVIGGDDQDVALLARSEPQRVRLETDQRVQISLFAAGMSRQLERVRPFDDMLRGAATVDPEIAALRADTFLRQRREAMSTLAGWIAARGPLRAELSIEEAAAILWTVTSPEVHHMLRVDWEWKAARYEHWLRRTLEAHLLPSDC